MARCVDRRGGRTLCDFLFQAALMVALLLAPLVLAHPAWAAPSASYMIDARTGKVLHSENAETPLHPASLTKMMTLYVAFDAIRRGEISLDTMVTVSAKAAAEPPSRLGLRAGQRISLRNLIRAAAIRSANDAATAIGEAISGSETAFAARMTRTAKAIGMTRTTFRNAHGLTAAGHLSTARDMTLLGRRLFYDFNEYYSLFSRVTADAGVAQVANTNRRFLESYRGADGIKTGYTNAAGFNLTASAERGNKRIIATVFGGTSTAQRNARMSALLDAGFGSAPNNVRETPPPRVALESVATAPAATAAVQGNGEGRSAAKTIRLQTAVATSPRPVRRPGAAEPPAEVVVAIRDDVQQTLTALAEAPAATAPAAVPVPAARPDAAVIAGATEVAATATDTTANSALGEARPEARPESVQAAAPIPFQVVDAADLPPDVADGTVALAEADLPDDLHVPAGEDAEALPENIRMTSALVVPAVMASVPRPQPRPGEIVMTAGQRDRDAATPRPQAQAQGEVVTRISTSGGRHWAVNLGRFPSRGAAERALLQTALSETKALDGALRKVVSRSGGFDANFVGLSRDQADLACRRLQARAVQCFTLGP